MNEKELIKIIEQYSAYVCTIIRNVANNFITECDVEEIASDGYRFGDIYCYSKPHSIDDIECITVYVMNYTENDLKADEYEIYKAE